MSRGSKGRTNVKRANHLSSMDKMRRCETSAPYCGGAIPLPLTKQEKVRRRRAAVLAAVKARLP